MTQIDLATAVREIVDTTQRRTTRDATAFPFFFIVGAGISAPTVPVASMIERICSDLASRKGIVVPDLPDDPMDRYERMLTLVHPSLMDIQEFLHELINEAPISRANFRLAHLLESRSVTNLVVTPNFDEMLTKALRLFGVDCVVCDHPMTTQRISPNRADVLQIVHVHGTHWFYDCCNLKGDIAARTSTGMADLLKWILADRSPVVIGYSGWPSDVIMTVLAGWLGQPIRPHNLYWFCHRASEVERLPDWLRNHGRVRLVVEKEPIEASAIFEAMITETGVTSPAVTSDPLAFFARHLEKTLGSKQDEKDIYFIGSVIARVRRGSELEAAERERMTEATRRATDAVAWLSDSVRRGASDEVLKAVAEVDVELLSVDQCIEVDAALTAFYVAKNRHELERVMRTCRTWQDAAEKVLAVNPEDPQRQAAMAFALFAETACLDPDSGEQELVLLDRLLSRFGHLKTRAIAQALANRAYLLLRMGKWEEATSVREQLRETFGQDPEMEPTLDLSLLNELVFCATDSMVLEFAEKIAAKYAGRSHYSIQNVGAIALKTRTRTLLSMGRYAEAVTSADDFLRDYLESRNAHVASVLLSKAEAHAALAQPEIAFATLDEFDRRMRESKSSEFNSYVDEAKDLRDRLTAPPPPPPDA